MDRRAIGIHRRVNLVRQAPSRAADILVIVVRDAGPMLMHADNGGVDHLDGGIATGGQRIHDPVPDASLPPTDKAMIASGAGTIGHRQVAPGTPEGKTRKMPFRTRRSSTRGTLRGLFGRNDRMAAHSKSVSSYRVIRGSRWSLQSGSDRYLQPSKPDNLHFRDYPVTGHAADMPRLTRMTQTGRQPSYRPGLCFPVCKAHPL